jgi:ribonucleoside-diphosphate reductase beta chain
MAQIEPILEGNKDRFVSFLIEHLDIWDYLKKLEVSFWTAEGIDLHKDFSDWTNKINSDERYFIKKILSFCTASNEIINKNLARNFVNGMPGERIRGSSWTP